MKDLANLRQKPPSDVFYQRNDPNDQRLGEQVTSHLDHYETADIVLLGCPQDQGVKRNQGRPGAKEAPQTIRRALYKMSVWGLTSLKLFDLGDTKVDGDLETIHKRHQTLVSRVIQDGKCLIVLGGGNDISYPDLAGLGQVKKDLLAFNIDAHFDVRADEKRNSGTPYRQALQEGHLQANRFFHLGYNAFANSETYYNYLTNLGVRCYPCDELQQGISVCLETCLKTPSEAIFWGLDMDVVNAAEAPGVSAANPYGLRAKDVFTLAKRAGSDKRTCIFEITEVNPAFDIDTRTSRLAAATLWYFIQAFASARGHQ